MIVYLNGAELDEINKIWEMVDTKRWRQIDAILMPQVKQPYYDIRCWILL
jgi:hypothetical protein